MPSSKAKRIPSLPEDVDYLPTTNGFVAVEDEGDQGTAITFQTWLATQRDGTWLATQRSVSPPHFLDFSEHATQRSISPPPTLLATLARRELVQCRSKAGVIPARSKHVHYWPYADEDEGDQGRQGMSIAPNIKLEDIKLAEQAADTAITFQTPLAPQRSVSPPHFLDFSEHAPQRSISPPPTLLATLARRELIQCRSKAGVIPARSKHVDYWPYADEDKGDQGRQSLSIAPNIKFEDIAEHWLEPPPARRQTATGLIASIFKKKRQMETFTSSIEKEQSVEVEPRPTSFGLARIFSYEELKEATSCFKQQIGDGGFSSVYLGKLPDQRMVAVKVLYEGIPKRFEQFINEVTVLSRLRHKNLVVLYGCTDPETKKLLLVYEFVPNGTIADHLHGKLPPLTWAVRIQMAIETAEALAYLHSLEPPIIHRDVKTSNILLDNDFHVKVADLGMCRLLPWDSKSVTTQPQGTQGYRDPEYELYCNLTDRSDVYSFGVVLLELLSGQQAVDVNREMNDIYLFRMALNMILNKELEQLVDPKLGYDSDCEIKRMIDLVAELACICLQPKADMRPSMLDVVSALKKIYNDM